MIIILNFNYLDVCVYYSLQLLQIYFLCLLFPLICFLIFSGPLSLSLCLCVCMCVCVCLSVCLPHRHTVSCLLSRHSSLFLIQLGHSYSCFLVNLGFSCSYSLPEGMYKSLEREPRFQISQELPLWWTLCALLVLESKALLSSYLFLLEWTQDPGDGPDCLLFPLSWIHAL